MLKAVAAPRAKVFALNPEGTMPIQLTGLRRVSFDQLLNDVGQLKMEFELTEVVLRVLVQAHPDAAVPIVIQVGGREMVWLTTHIEEDYSTPAPVVSVIAVSPEKYLEGLFTWPDPYLPPETQVSKVLVRVGPIAWLVKNEILRANLTRVKMRTLGSAAHVVAKTVDADNYTRWTIISSKMGQSLDLVRSLLDPEGLTLTATLYLPGRGQPVPDGHDGRKPAIVWDVKQRAEIPSGGLFLAGLARSFGDFWKDVWGVLSDHSGQGVPATSNAVDYWGKPQLLIRKHQVAELRVETTKPTATMYTVGGQSPEWLNKLLTSLLGTLLNMASGGLGIMLDTSALDSVLDDRFMSYHSYTDITRRARTGPFGMIETFTPSVGLSVDAVMMLKQAQYKSRATRVHEAVLHPSAGLVPGRDFEIGSMVALELPGDRYVVSFVAGIKYEWSVDAAPMVTVQISDRPKRDPLEAVMRQMTGLATAINKAALLD